MAVQSNLEGLFAGLGMDQVFYIQGMCYKGRLNDISRLRSGITRKRSRHGQDTRQNKE